MDKIAKDQWEKELLAKYRNRSLIDRIEKESVLMAKEKGYDDRKDDLTLTPRGGRSARCRGEVTKFKFYKLNPETAVFQ